MRSAPRFLIKGGSSGSIVVLARYTWHLQSQSERNLCLPDVVRARAAVTAAAAVARTAQYIKVGSASPRQHTNVRANDHEGTQTHAHSSQRSRNKRGGAPGHGHGESPPRWEWQMGETFR